MQLAKGCWGFQAGAEQREACLFDSFVSVMKTVDRWPAARDNGAVPA